MTKRTDVHAPASSNFDPESYDFYGVFDNQEHGRQIGVQTQLLAQRGYGCGMYGPHQCGHCGSHLRYCALMVR